MNTRRGKLKIKNFCILLDSGCTSTLLMIRLVKKLSPEGDAPMLWNTQAGNIATNIKVKIDFTLPTLSKTNAVSWNFHVDDSAKGRYNMILGRDISTELVLNLK